jgi:superfamily II DNA or RNA helicase
MVTIIRHQRTCKIITDDDELIQDLDNELSFIIPGAEFSKAYKGFEDSNGNFVQWDGRTKLLKPNCTFASGLYYRVLDFLSLRGIVPDIEDARPAFSESTPIDILPRLSELNKTPRPYQIEISDIAIRHDRCTIKACTGCGKSLIIALITAKLGKPTLILVVGIDLLYQMHKLFTDVFQKEIGIVGDGNCVIKDINIASVWTIGKVLNTDDATALDDEDNSEKDVAKEKYQDIRGMLSSAKVVQIDEAHFCGSNTLLEINKHLSAENIIGLSASPHRDDNKDLLIESIIGKKVVDLSARDMIAQGYLVRPIIRFLAPEPYPYKTGAYQKVYSKYIIENEQRNGMVIKAALKLIDQGFIPLILFRAIKHGKILHNLIKDKTSVVLLSGKDSSGVREQAKKDIDDGKIKCIIASKIFDCGVDLPRVSALVISSSGKSSIRSVQQPGRVIRPYPGKKIAAIVDFADSAPYLMQHSLRRKEIYEMEFDDVSWPATIPVEKVDPVESS